MAVPTFSTYIDGTAITENGLQANMNAGRVWLNSLDNTDLQNGSIRSENLVRPVISGFPNNSIESTFQSLWWMEYGNLSAPNSGVDPEGWGPMPNRLTIFPWQVSAGSLWPTPFGKTIYLPFAASVEINLSFDLIANGNTSTAFYPTGTGTGVRGGRFSICRRDRTTNVIVEESLSEAYVYMGNISTTLAPRFAYNANCMAVEDMAAGYHDIFLAYKRETADSLLVYQVDISRLIGKIEAG